MGFETAYPLIIPGGPKDLVEPEHPRDSEYLLKKIELLSNDFRILGVMAHNECLACGKRDDPAYYEDLLIRAGAILTPRFPRLEVVLIFADFDGLYIVGEEPEVASRQALAVA